MTGYPGDEHLFSVVVIVLARSPDCNLRSLVILCVPAALLHCVVSDLSVLHLSLYSVDCECVSCVFVPRLSSSVCISPAHFQTAVDKLRCSCKADSVITLGDRGLMLTILTASSSPSIGIAMVDQLRGAVVIQLVADGRLEESISARALVQIR